MEPEEFRALATGTVIYGALTMIGIFTLGILWHLPIVAVFAVIDAGVSYASLMSQISLPREMWAYVVQGALVALSVLIGLAAIIMLLFAALIGG